MIARLSAAAVEAFLRALSLLPLPAAHGLGWVVGTLLWLIPNPARKHAWANIRFCLPELSRRERRRLLRRSLQEAGKTGTETGIMWYASPRRLERVVHGVDGQALLDAGVDSGKGVLVIIPHLGSWELMATYFGNRLPLNSMYRPPRMRLFEPIIRRARGRTGGRLWPATPPGVRGAFKVLRQGEVLGVLPDQLPAEAGVYADFFGIPAKTMTLVPRLAQKTGAMVLTVVAERLPWGRGYRIRFQRAPEGVRDPDVGRAAAAMNDAIEALVRALPEQYQWTYRRFRDRPVGVKSPYSQPKEFAASLEAWKARGRPGQPQRVKKGTRS